MSPILIDSHTHVQFPQFDSDRADVISRALEVGIWMINVGANKKHSQDAVDLAHKYNEGVYATVGAHPHEIGEGWDYEFYKNLAQDEKVVAIGECGLDYYRDKQQETRDKQRKLFLEQIGLSKELEKPLMIHCREAFPDLIEILSMSHVPESHVSNILHFFTGTLGNAKKLLDLGFYFTFGGLITFPPKAGQSSEFDEIIKFIPLNRILVETDAPYVAPAPYRGKRNEPLYVIEVAKKIAELKNITFEEFCEKITENNKKVFSI